MAGEVRVKKRVKKRVAASWEEFGERVRRLLKPVGFVRGRPVYAVKDLRKLDLLPPDFGSLEGSGDGS